MIIAQSVLVLIVAVPLIFGFVLGFSLGKIGISSLVDSIRELENQMASFSIKLDEIKNTPVFPVQDYRPAPANLL